MSGQESTSGHATESDLSAELKAPGQPVQPGATRFLEGPL